MGGRSTVTNVLLTLLLVGGAAGLVIVVDSNDHTRAALEDVRQALEENTRALRRLRQAPGQLAPHDEQAGAEERAFHNSDLRDPQTQPGGERVTAVSNFSGNLNYVINNEGTVGEIWGLCNDSPGARNYREPTRFEPRMARDWEVSDDGRTITVHLREGILWHPFTDPVTEKHYEARPVTAQDFAFYIDTIRNPELPCDPIRNYYQDLDRIEVIDEHTFQAIWKETYFRALEFTLGLDPLPRHLYRPDPDTTDEEFAGDMLKDKAERNQIVVGCGPYVFKEYVRGEKIVLERNPDYYGPPPPIARRVLREIKDTEKQFLELKRGALDALGLTSVQWVHQSEPPRFLTVCDDLEDAERLTREHDEAKKAAFRAGEPFGEHDFEKFLYRRFAYNFIAWNLRKDLFADRRVRLALTHCVNRPKIIEEVFFGLGVQTTGNFVPHSLYYDHDIEPWPFDIDRAKELLAEAGWTDTDDDGVVDKDLDGDGEREPFEFYFLMIANHPYQSKWVPMVQQDLQRAGIMMGVKSAEWSVYTETMDEFAFDAVSFYWGGGIESDPYQLWHGSLADNEGSSNVCGFDHAEANRITETARRTLDLDKRMELYKRFHRILHEEQPYTFIYCPHAKLAQSKRYCNAIVYPLGMSSNLQWVPERMQRQ